MAAAHRALIDLYPKQRAEFDAAARACLAEIPPGPARDAGIELGRHVAERVLAARAGDAAADKGKYVFRGVPGAWRPTPLAFAEPLLPGWGNVAPFAIRKGTQLRPPGPPALTSKAYADAYREVWQLGGKDSKARTPEQTEIALFWSDDVGTSTPPGHWNRIAQQVARQRKHSLMENARLFASLNVSLADAAVLCWVLKFTHDFWRPATGIPAADEDGNPDTLPERGWLPLLNTPPFPAYTSGHSSFSGAASAVLAEFCGGDAFELRDTSEGLPGVTRSFKSFTAAAEEAGQSRIYGGIHWQFDNTDGLVVGRHLGRYVHRNFFQPRPPAAGASRRRP